ncbi:MAG: MarR family transcriptional regulator [Tissierellia bacterium]|nr:MarR family transcriptional regulator [Tissierellia bacterium]
MLKRFERFSSGIFSLHKIWHKIASDALKPYDLTSSHLTYLMALIQSEDGLTSSELVEICGKDKSDVSRSLNTMANKGLVNKESSHKKGYGGVFFLTEKGMEVAGQTYDKVAFAVEYATKNIPEEKKEIFYEVLGLFDENLNELNEKTKDKEGDK